MRYLLAQNSLYVPAHGGANKANRLLLEQLAARGHFCRAVCRATGAQSLSDQALPACLSARGIASVADSLNSYRFDLCGVHVCAVKREAAFRSEMKDEIASFQPDWVLISSEDPAQALLESALDVAPDRVVYFARTTLMLPFGPGGFLPSQQRTRLIGKCAAIIAVSHYLSSYIQRWGNLRAEVLPLPVYGSGPFPQFDNFDSGFVFMVNPSAVKGIAIFAALAEEFPDIPFAAVPGWGTTPADRTRLAAIPNMQLLPPCDDIDLIFQRVRVLLVPSLWDEALGRIVIEAMLRGIPVLASDVGGLPEAKLGIEYTIPVKPISRYEDQLDERMMPHSVVPEQDLVSWRNALAEVLFDRERYQKVASESRTAATRFVAGLNIEAVEAFFRSLKPRGAPLPPESDSNEPLPPAASAERLAFSPAQRALFVQRLLQRKQDRAPSGAR